MKQVITVEGLNEKLNIAIYESGLDLSEICKRAKISRHMLWQYRFYSVTPGALALARLAVVLNVSADYLLGISDKKELECVI